MCFSLVYVYRFACTVDALCLNRKSGNVWHVWTRACYLHQKFVAWQHFSIKKLNLTVLKHNLATLQSATRGFERRWERGGGLAFSSNKKALLFPIVDSGAETSNERQPTGKLSSTSEVYERVTDRAQINTAVSARDNIRESSNPPVCAGTVGVFSEYERDKFGWALWSWTRCRQLLLLWGSLFR